VTIDKQRVPVLAIEYGGDRVGKIRMRSTVARRLILSKPQTDDGVPIVVHYKHPEIGYDSDMIHGARFVGAKAVVEGIRPMVVGEEKSEAPADDGLAIEFSIEYRYVAWTERRIRLDKTTAETKREEVSA
jgi:hypothetical protein